MVNGGFAGAELTVETGPLAGTRLLLDRPLITIGRAEDNDIRLDDDMVSKNHCRIITQGENYLIEDLASSNGTIVNGQQVNTHMLQDGDKLFLGDTTLLFRKAVPVAPQAGKPAASKKKWIWVTVGILGGLVVVAGGVAVLLFLLLQQKDKVAPTASIKSPTANQVFYLNMPVLTGKEITINVSASDNKGLDRIEIMSGQQVLKTFKATKARKESQVEGMKTEDFAMAWTTPVGDYSLRAKAYDWKGNIGESDPVQVKVQLGGDVDAAHQYCQRIDQLVIEYSTYRQKFSKAYSDAPAGKMGWDQAGTEFAAVGQERRSLLESLNNMTPPAQFADAHARFKTMVTYALNADEAAVQWASAEYYNTQPYYYYDYSTTDPSVYKRQVDDWSSQAQSAAKSFSSQYNLQRKEQLGIDPGPNP